MHYDLVAFTFRFCRYWLCFASDSIFIEDLKRAFLQILGYHPVVILFNLHHHHQQTRHKHQQNWFRNLHKKWCIFLDHLKLVCSQISRWSAS
jgi:hypothetical protein